MLDALKKFFRSRHADETAEQQPSATPKPLRIEGVKPAPLTPEPDNAELAAQALLESMEERAADARADLKSDRNEYKDLKSEKKRRRIANADTHRSRIANPSEHAERAPHDAAYYHALADRIRTARSAEARLVMRLLASVEEQLAEPTALYKGQWGDTERKLYRAMDIAEREGGELKSRWQHCLANVLVRRMEEEREEMEDGRRKMEDGDGDGTQVSHLRDAERQQPAPAETPPQNPTEGRTTNPTEGRLAMPTEGRPADTTQETSSQTVLPVTEAAINQP